MNGESRVATKKMNRRRKIKSNKVERKAPMACPKGLATNPVLGVPFQRALPLRFRANMTHSSFSEEVGYSCVTTPCEKKGNKRKRNFVRCKKRNFNAKILFYIYVFSHRIPHRGTRVGVGEGCLHGPEHCRVVLYNDKNSKMRRERQTL